MNNCRNHNHNCIAELQNDHERILASLDELENGVKESVKGETMNPVRKMQWQLLSNGVNSFLEFTKNFSEPHHHKEEKILFPKLEEKGIPNEGGPIGMMLFEHNLKRNYIRELEEALAQKDGPRIKEKSLAIVSLMRDHIWKENNILYPCAQDILTEEEMEAISTECAEKIPNF